MSKTVFAYTNRCATRSEALRLVREDNGDLFMAVQGPGSFVVLPAAHKRRLLEWLQADLEAEEAEAAARAEGRLVVGLEPTPVYAARSAPGLRVVQAGEGLGYSGALASPHTERSAALGKAPPPVVIAQRDPGDEGSPPAA